jgi:uncharacterized cupin superfamily protein
VLLGEVVFVTDAGEAILRAGDWAGFKAGRIDGHWLQNRSSEETIVLEVGTRTPDDACYYSDIDMAAPAGGKPALYTHCDGTSNESIVRRS